MIRDNDPGKSHVPVAVHMFPAGTSPAGTALAGMHVCLVQIAHSGFLLSVHSRHSTTGPESGKPENPPFHPPGRPVPG